ncbi:MAG: glycosyltransferase family 2 protein [Gammaproteobacteria bacterium]|nr:glycosyltransferase family 2 protein [Gammaproteobacteria bacterium]MDH3751889.1 glycosyltransferase family 2 protein [Gammaproteobacteria bacterium]
MSALIDGFLGIFYRVAASGALPAAWFRRANPATVEKSKRTGKLSLEIVCHCWRYGHYLTYQLSSLVNHRTDKLDITMTVYHAAGDEAVTRVLDFFQDIDVPGVTWNWQVLPKERLFRRSIGRNIAAKSTTADWIWFTDCDIIFHENCLDTLADELQGRDDPLVFPRFGLGTTLLEEDDEILTKGREGPAILEIPLRDFVPYLGERSKAKGPYQITHGDVARACGYCDSIGLYQKPSERWRKTYEDRAYRWLMGTHGTALDVPGACQIRHVVKGRYKKDSFVSTIRANIRKTQSRLG